MFEKNPEPNESLDRLGKVLLRAASLRENASDAAADAPFLYTRVRARITDEQRRREEAGGWLSLLFVARRAVPAMALIAFIAAVLTFWSAPSTAPAGWQRLDDEALADTRDPGVEQAVLASGNGLSPDEVFSIVVEREK
jgi:hypothetical protein